MPRDLPGLHDRPERPARAGADLSHRLDRLPADHPSSPRYQGADARAGQADRLVPAADRPEWQSPLARGAVDRVGRGIVDERASQFQPRERRVADHLAREGRAVVAVHDGYGREGRKPDAAVDGIPTEFKSLDRGASDTTVKAALTSAKGQARHAVIDGRGSGLDRAKADQGIRRFLGTPHGHGLDVIRIIGDNYDLDWKRG